MSPPATAWSSLVDTDPALFDFASAAAGPGGRLPLTGEQDCGSHDLIAMSDTTIPETMIEPHEPHWISRAAFPVLVAIFFATQAAMFFSVHHDNYWFAVPLVLVSSHLMHGMLIGFHEASHGLLRKSRVLNEIDGIIIGILSLMSFSLYRAAHQSHHAYLATERDEELWPFVHTRMPRPARVLAAILELTFGLFFTPFLFMRAFLREGSPIRNKKLRRRIWIEFGLTGFVWAGILTAVAGFDVWKYFLWLYLIPAWLAANMQSVRKYIEHVGLTDHLERRQRRDRTTRRNEAEEVGAGAVDDQRG